MDRSTQTGDVQPEEYTSVLGMAKPLHVSVTWGSISEFFVQVAEAALWPGGAMPEGKEGEDEGEWVRWWVVGGAVVAVGAAAAAIWRRVGRD